MTTPIDEKKLRKMFHRDEGFREKPYKCTAGKVTIGIGRNLDDVGISEMEAYALLGSDVRRAEQTCRAIFGDAQWERWSENRQLGWLNIAFNLGYGRLLGFRNTLRSAIQERWDEVDVHLRASHWYRQVGSRADRVIAMICREEYPYA